MIEILITHVKILKFPGLFLDILHVVLFRSHGLLVFEKMCKIGHLEPKYLSIPLAI
jgi:hypothetical protein